MSYHSTRNTNPWIANDDGAIIRFAQELSRLMKPNEKLDALIMVGWLLRDQDKVDHDTAARLLTLRRTRYPSGVVYSLDVEEKGIYRNYFEAEITRDGNIIQRHFRKGQWEHDLDFWFRVDQDLQRRKLAESVA